MNASPSSLALSLLLPLAALFSTTTCPAQQPAMPHWSLGAPVLDLSQPSQGAPIKLLDPCAVRHDGRWHVFAGSMYFALDEFKPGGPSPQPVKLPVEGAFVPQVFFYSPKKQWHFIGQIADTSGRYPKSVPVLSTNENLSTPQGWSKPVILDVPPPETGDKPVKSWMDFYVICDDTKAHLFATGGGRMWRSETALEKYPNGWSKPVVALEGDFLYASHTYRLDMPGKPPRYWMNLTGAKKEADGRRLQYQQSYVAEKLEGPWHAELATAESPLAGWNNIRMQDGDWTGDIVHGEPLRTSIDEHMLLDPAFAGFIFHGGHGSSKTPCIGVLERIKP
ncbi:non-reducing end alpha-L-arabinofuranosidase family hydrolase [Prosthecobacter vanneervenii]|uniref:non-reducing end alpha-L-arabinofuranosidase n=1 Tax=Prosthecobacter vanneervenii TaxID=48466 RepID=A0A7W7Y6Y5_9BACT|nr:non-reducing end alpha-L-arabinofuranosidase family hydrolase [Prosthecobacter vanneervenii]MBB5030734.1 hypothetical protein [Prosthecobacter vanneervenii]